MFVYILLRSDPIYTRHNLSLEQVFFPTYVFYSCLKVANCGLRQ